MHIFRPEMNKCSKGLCLLTELLRKSRHTAFYGPCIKFSSRKMFISNGDANGNGKIVGTQKFQLIVLFQSIALSYLVTIDVMYPFIG